MMKNPWARIQGYRFGMLLWDIFFAAGDQRVGKPVTDSHNSYLFIASSQTDLEQWAKAINIVIYTVS